MLKLSKVSMDSRLRGGPPMRNDALTTAARYPGCRP
jgi:hypothetical protein